MTYEGHFCWRCKGKRIIEDKSGKSGREWWVCPVCDPNLPGDVYTSRYKVNPVKPTERGEPNGSS